MFEKVKLHQMNKLRIIHVNKKIIHTWTICINRYRRSLDIVLIRTLFRIEYPFNVVLLLYPVIHALISVH